MDDQLKMLIRADVMKALPQLEEDRAEQLAVHLVSSEIETLDNLCFVKEDDIKAFVGIFNARKLINEWSTRGKRLPENPGQVALGERLRHSSYKVNYETLHLDDDGILDALKENKMLSPTQLDDVVQAVVKQVQKKVPGVERKFFKGLAQDMLADYPSSFKDIILKRKSEETEVLRTDSEKLTYKLKNKFDNNNRKSKDKCNQETSQHIPEAAGCKRWQVTTLPEGEDEESLNDKKKEMQDIYEMNRRMWDWEKIEQNMKSTYGMQRADLNTQVSGAKRRGKKRKQPEAEAEQEDSPAITTNKIIEDYPFLMTTQGINIHFEELTGKCFKSELEGWIEEVDPVLIDFLATKHEDNPKVRHRMRKATASPEDAKVMAIMTMLVNSLHEDLNLLYKCINPGTLIDEVTQSCEIPSTPCIFALGDDIFDCKKFYFSIDGVVRTSVKSFRGALLLCFCSYFTFNILYPESLGNTLDFVQRSIVNIDPKGRSRVPKKKRGPNTVAYALTKLNTQFKVYEEKLQG